jgi:hypothetical protein
MNDQDEIRVTSIGHIAHQALLRIPAGYVTGTTSQGIYLQLYDDLTLFLSTDPFRGPLTINIRGKKGDLDSINPGKSAELAGDRIIFSNSQLTVRYEKPIIWKATPPPPHITLSPGYIEQITDCVRVLHPDHPELPLLEILTADSPFQIRFDSGIDSLFFRSFIKHKSGDPSKYINEMKMLLGSGPGLTPLGDDLILGILLSLIRTRGKSFWVDDETYSFQSVVNSAKLKTTKISWSLLYCAIRGTADERIIRVLDGLIADREIPDQDLENLLNWGSSSGIAVLSGMLMVLS